MTSPITTTSNSVETVPRRPGHIHEPIGLGNGPTTSTALARPDLNPTDRTGSTRPEPGGPDRGDDVLDSDRRAALARVIDVRNGQRALGQARTRLLQTSMIFQALLALALALSVFAIVDGVEPTPAGSPDAEPPSVLVQTDG